MKLDVYLDFEKVNSVEEATHILALKDYGEIKKGEIVEIFQVADIVYVYDMGADEENELLNEADQNFLYKVNKRIL